MAQAISAASQPPNEAPTSSRSSPEVVDERDVVLDERRHRVDAWQLRAVAEAGVVRRDHVEVCRQPLEIRVPQAGATGGVEDEDGTSRALPEHAAPKQLCACCGRRPAIISLTDVPPCC